MEAKEYFKILEKIHTTVFATNDENKHPFTCVVDIMLADENGIYFVTEKGSGLYKRLKKSRYASVSGVEGEGSSLSKKAISIRGKVKFLKKEKLDTIIEKNAYLKEIYQSEEELNKLVVFYLYEGEGDVFDLTSIPPKREYFDFGHKKEVVKAPKPMKSGKKYEITSKCKRCGRCKKKCPVGCIKKGKPYIINQEKCIACGGCYKVCPYHAINKNA